jgi:hypothetical protein
MGLKKIPRKTKRKTVNETLSGRLLPSMPKKQASAFTCAGKKEAGPLGAVVRTPFGFLAAEQC